ncbi:MAG: hypothetical protein EBE86_021590 [Hormoscilla sp. GUM202]|nr:hypothetical protein [Hormoscilla sp. GUM202]
MATDIFPGRTCFGGGVILLRSRCAIGGLSTGWLPRADLPTQRGDRPLPIQPTANKPIAVLDRQAIPNL